MDHSTTVRRCLACEIDWIGLPFPRTGSVRLRVGEVNERLEPFSASGVGRDKPVDIPTFGLKATRQNHEGRSSLHRIF